MHQDVKQKVEQLVKELQHLYEDRLVSVCVYGSAVIQESLPRLREKFQDINVLVILKGLDHRDLEKASSIGKWWDQVAHSLPMFLSEHEWLRSADVFALEYADIRDNHFLAFGKDLFSQTPVDYEALRLVCELELHRKLIYLRQRLLIKRDNPKELLKLLQKDINSITAIFRGVQRLQNASGVVPQKAQMVFEGLAPLVEGYNAAPFLRVLLSREPNTKVRESDITALYNEFIHQVSLVNTYVDECLNVKEGACS